MVPFPDVSKLSAIAAELERRYPHASVGEIYAMAKPTVDGAVAVAAGARTDGNLHEDSDDSIDAVYKYNRKFRRCSVISTYPRSQ
jgi:hypothetical protein